MTSNDPAASGAGQPRSGVPAPPGHPGTTHVTITTMTGGSVATGDHGRAESVNVSVQGLDQAQQQLLSAISDLRRGLTAPDGASAAGGDGALLAQLDEVQGEITQHGEAPRPMLARLLAGLAAYGPAAATAASVTAVIQALAPLLA